MFATSLVLRASPVEIHACLDAIWHVAEERPQLCVSESIEHLPDGRSKLRPVHFFTFSQCQGTPASGDPLRRSLSSTRSESHTPSVLVR